MRLSSRRIFGFLSLVFLVVPSVPLQAVGIHAVLATSIVQGFDCWTDSSEYQIGQDVTVYVKIPEVYLIARYWLTIYKPDGSQGTRELGELLPAETYPFALGKADRPSGEYRIEFWMNPDSPQLLAYCVFNVREVAPVRFYGTAIEYFTRIGAYGWKVHVDEPISSIPISMPEVVDVYLAPSPLPQGYMDPDTKPGDKVEVYGSYQAGSDVTLLGSTDYYIKRVGEGGALVNLFSATTDGKYENVGKIHFDGWEYSLPAQVKVPSGKEHGVEAYPPPDYSFNNWEVSGGVSVEKADSWSTSAHVEGSGYLKAWFKPGDEPPNAKFRASVESGELSSHVAAGFINVVLFQILDGLDADGNIKIGDKVTVTDVRTNGRCTKPNQASIDDVLFQLPFPPAVEVYGSDGAGQVLVDCAPEYVRNLSAQDLAFSGMVVYAFDWDIVVRIADIESNPYGVLPPRALVFVDASPCYVHHTCPVDLPFAARDQISVRGKLYGQQAGYGDIREKMPYIFVHEPQHYAVKKFKVEVTLKSATTDGKTGVGSISFNGVTCDTLPASALVASNSWYAILAKPPDLYTLDRWEIIDGVTDIRDRTAESTEVYVKGAGTVTAWFKPITNTPPELSIEASVKDCRKVDVNGEAKPTTHGAEITRTHIDWGDGESEDRWLPASHTYKNDGTYTITVTAYDSNGLSATKTAKVTIACGGQIDWDKEVAWLTDLNNTLSAYKAHFDPSFWQRLTEEKDNAIKEQSLRQSIINPFDGVQGFLKDHLISLYSPALAESLGIASMATGVLESMSLVVNIYSAISYDATWTAVAQCNLQSETSKISGIVSEMLKEAKNKDEAGYRSKARQLLSAIDELTPRRVNACETNLKLYIKQENTLWTYFNRVLRSVNTLLVVVNMAYVRYTVLLEGKGRPIEYQDDHTDDAPYIVDFKYEVNGHESYVARPGDEVTLTIVLKPLQYRIFQCTKVAVTVYKVYVFPFPDGEDRHELIGHYVTPNMGSKEGSSVILAPITFAVGQYLWRGYHFSVSATCLYGNAFDTSDLPFGGNDLKAKWTRLPDTSPPRLRVESKSGLVFSIAEQEHRLHLRVVDNQNRVVGFMNGNILKDIPGSDYVTQEHAAVAYVPDVGTYRVYVDASEAEAGTETYNLTLTECEGNRIMHQSTLSSSINNGETKEYSVELTAVKEPKLREGPAQQYVVTFFADPTSGTISAGAFAVSNGGARTYASGTRVHVVANAPSGYVFSNWVVSGVSVDNTIFPDTYMTVSSNGSLRAVFSQIPPPPPQQKPQLNYLLALIIILITAVAAIALAYRQRGTRVARRASAPPRIVDIERGKPPPAPTHRPPTAIQPVLPEHGVSEAIKPGHVPRVVGRRREKK